MSLSVYEGVIMRVIVGFIIAVFWAIFWGIDGRAQQAPEIVVSFFWLLIGVSALLVAVGALLVFIKLAHYLDRLTERLKE